MKTILVIDGKGGGIGSALVAKLKSKNLDALVLALGTNALATSAMLKSGADDGATGDNAIIVNCASADIICGPIGIIVANSMLGEVSPGIACAVGSSGAAKFLIPAAKCSVEIIGVAAMTMAQYITKACDEIEKLMA